MEPMERPRSSGILEYVCFNKPHSEILSISSYDSEFDNYLDPNVPPFKTILPPHLLRHIRTEGTFDFTLPDPDYNYLKRGKPRKRKRLTPQSDSSCTSGSRPVCSLKKVVSALEKTEAGYEYKFKNWKADFKGAYRNEYDDCEAQTWEQLANDVKRKRWNGQPDVNFIQPHPVYNGKNNRHESNGITSTSDETSSPSIRTNKKPIREAMPMSPETTKRNEFYSYLKIGAKPSVNSDGTPVEPNRRSIRVRNININKERDRSISLEFRSSVQNGVSKPTEYKHIGPNKVRKGRRVSKSSSLSNDIRAVNVQLRPKFNPRIRRQSFKATKMKTQNTKLRGKFRQIKRRKLIKKSNNLKYNSIVQTRRQKLAAVSNIIDLSTTDTPQTSEHGFSQMEKQTSEKYNKILRLATLEVANSIRSMKSTIQILPKVEKLRKKSPKRKVPRYYRLNGPITRRRNLNNTMTRSVYKKNRIPLNNNNILKRSKPKVRPQVKKQIDYNKISHESYEKLKLQITELLDKMVSLTGQYSFSDSLSSSDDSKSSFHGFGPEPCSSLTSDGSTSVSYSEITEPSEPEPQKYQEPSKNLPMSPSTIRAFHVKKSPKNHPCHFGTENYDTNWSIFSPSVSHEPQSRQPTFQKLLNKTLVTSSQPKGEHCIKIEESDGEISGIHFVNSTLIIAQESVISFWDQTPLGTMLGCQNMWMNWGKLQRLKLETGCLSVSSKRETCFFSDNVVAYVELWGKEHKSEKRERPIADIFATIYFHQMKGNILEKKVIQLENIIGYTQDVKFTTLEHKRIIIISWRDQYASPSQITQLRIYQLATDFQTVLRVTDLEPVEHYVSAVHHVRDCSEIVLGIGDFNVSIWQSTHGQLMTTIVISPPLLNITPQRRDFEVNCLWASCDRGYLFLITKTDSNNCLNLIAVSGLHTGWKHLKYYRIPPNHGDISSVSIEGGILTGTSKKGIVCWSMQTGAVLLECFIGPKTKIFLSDRYISLLDTYLNVTVKNIFAFLSED